MVSTPNSQGYHNCHSINTAISTHNQEGQAALVILGDFSYKELVVTEDATSLGDLEGELLCMSLHKKW